MITSTTDSRIMNHRIEPLDGLRAVAVTGVIWVHAWTFFGNIPLHFAGVDWNKGIALAGVGVDLFFVISGFCMYLMYRRGVEKQSDGSGLKKYRRFLVKRWTRIAPAFYAVLLFESMLYLWHYGIFPLPSFAAHLVFLNTFLKDNVLSPPFWSLSTEWQFYLLLPFLFYRSHKKETTGSEVKSAVKNDSLPAILILIALSLVCRLLLYQHHAADLRSGVTVTSDKILYRFPEFGWGMLAARFFLSGRAMPAWLSGAAGFMLSFGIVVAGRIMMVTGIYQLAQSWGFVVRSLGEPVMTLGFALMLLNLIRSQTVFSWLLSTGPMLFLGRISYSMYLWHWLVMAYLCRWWLPRFGVSNGSMQLSFAAGFLIVAAVGWLSWYLFERPYFARSTAKTSRLPAAAIPL